MHFLFFLGMLNCSLVSTSLSHNTDTGVNLSITSCIEEVSNMPADVGESPSTTQDLEELVVKVH